MERKSEDLRTFNTEIREPWNKPIHNILKTIDIHNEEFIKTGNHWHLEKAKVLKDYLIELKSWIIRKETNK